MKKQLFFDDNKLFSRENVTRNYGVPQLISTYSDGISSCDFCTGYLFRLDNGKYRLLYTGGGKDFEVLSLFSAISDDGVNFVPEKLYDDPKALGKRFDNEVMRVVPEGSEIAFIYEDMYCEKSERYKMLFEYRKSKFEMNDIVYTSSDLINWKEKEGSVWADGTEPLASVFYNKHNECYTVCERPFWGVRKVGYKDTKDWINFSEYRECLNVDSSDEVLSEIYGLYAFEYDGMYIGLPHIYRNIKSSLSAKYKEGIVDTQLAYSYDGHYWKRSLRQPFISGQNPKEHGDAVKRGLVWVSSVHRCDDGSINFYASSSEYEHGPAFTNPGTGKMLVYKLREDGFIYFKTDDKNKESCIATREKVWHGGEVHINLKVKKATIAVYISDESEHVVGNVLGIAKPLEGYSHDDCIPFSGDSTDWVPEYKTGRKIEDLVGKTIVFELKFEDGEVFSLSGDYTDVYNTQAAKYRRFGVLPE